MVYRILFKYSDVKDVKRLLDIEGSYEVAGIDGIPKVNDREKYIEVILDPK